MWRVMAMCGVVLFAAVAVAQSGGEGLQGRWTAVRGERDGNAAEDVVGHRVSFAGDRFRIESKNGALLYAGIVVVDSRVKPAAVDFRHTEGTAKGTVWKGIYAVEGDTLTVCDNAPNPERGRPTAFEARSGSGYVVVTFKRDKS